MQRQTEFTKLFCNVQKVRPRVPLLQLFQNRVIYRFHRAYYKEAPCVAKFR